MPIVKYKDLITTPEMQAAIDKINNNPDLNRQEKYQQRMKVLGRCRVCGEPAEKSGQCHEHLMADRERSLKRYYKNKKTSLDKAA